MAVMSIWGLRSRSWRSEDDGKVTTTAGCPLRRTRQEDRRAIMGGNTRLIASPLPARTEMQYAAVQILTLGKGGEKSQSSAGRRGDCLRLFPDEGDPGAPDSGGLQTRDPTKEHVALALAVSSGRSSRVRAGRDRSGFGWARTTALLCVGEMNAVRRAGYSPRGVVGAWGLTGRESRLVRQCRSSGKRLEYGAAGGKAVAALMLMRFHLDWREERRH